MKKVKVNLSICRGCGLCQRVCPSGAISLVYGKAHIDERMCQRCYRCINVCPFGAISLGDSNFSQEIESLEKDIAELKKRIDNILKNENSNSSGRQ